ncbi:MAG: membrane fusion protein (multidrug efflux system), partial [Francisellaceae bacterium]
MSEEKLDNNSNLEKKKTSKFSPKQIVIGCSIIAATAAGIYGYYRYNNIFPTTDNAYVDADVINISAKVGGFIQKVYVQNNQFVHKGDKLVQIDAADYKLKLAKSDAEIIQAKGQLAVANEQVSVARSNLIKSRSTLQTATIMSDRYVKLYNEGAGSLQDAQKYIDQKVQSQKSSDQSFSSLKQALIQIDVAKAKVNAAKVGSQNSTLNLGYTTLIAPSDGYISNLKIYSGQLISAGQSLFGFINNKNWWINAN